MSSIPDVYVGSKRYWMSRTLWLNLITILIVLADILSGFELPFVAAEWYLGLVALLNAVLRLLTVRPVGLHEELTPVSKFP